MRRLPIFLVLDCSESMLGDSLKNMETGLEQLVTSLRRDPQALETVHLSLIAYAGQARTIVPLTTLDSFYPPKLPLGGGTSLGLALKELMAQMDAQVKKNTPETKGDWKPIVYLFTDGRATDKPEKMIQKWQAEYARQAQLIAVGLGDYADFSVLKKLTETVFHYKGEDDRDFKQFVDWLSQSTLNMSCRVENPDGDALPEADPNIISLVKKGDHPAVKADQNCVVIPGRCQKSCKLYLIKYDREQDILPFDARSDVKPKFVLSGCYPMDESYFEWSSPEMTNLTVNTEELSGAPGCPYCGNVTAFAYHLKCGKALCLNGPGEVVCPWCGETIFFGPARGDKGGQGFEVQRSRG